MNIEEMKRIVDGAPIDEGSEQVLLAEGVPYFTRLNGTSLLEYLDSHKTWVKCHSFQDVDYIHNLSDLRTILEQDARIKALEAQLKEREPKRWFTYCCDDGYAEHESEEAAKQYADDLIRGWLNDCWGEEVANVRMGIVTHEATEGERTYPKGKINEDGYDEDDVWWQPEWEYMVNWELQPLPQAPKEKDDE